MRYWILLGIIGIGLGVAFITKRPHQETPITEVSKTKAVTPAPHADQLSPPEIVLGNLNAKDTVIMYFAPTCHHCAEYEKNILPTIDKEFIQTGKIKFIMRILPFHALDFAVGKIALFKGKNQFQKTVQLFLENQDKWLTPIYEDEQHKEKLLKAKLEELSKKLSMETKAIESALNITHDDELAFVKLFCLENGWPIKDILAALKSNPELEKSFASSHLKATKEDGEMVDYVPAFYINDELQEDWVKPETLKEDLEDGLEQSGKPTPATETKPEDQPSQPLGHTKPEVMEGSMHDSQNQTLPPVDAEE